MGRYTTLEYKKINGSEPILMDVYSPSFTTTEDVLSLPIVMFFHGGALTVGNRGSYFPIWLKDRVLSLGYAFVSADYRLLIPTTGQEVVEDIRDAFRFVANNQLPGNGYTFKLDGDRIAVSGNSAGGLCARLATIHARPRPKVLIDIYGQGENFFTQFHLKINLTWSYADGPPKGVTGTDVDSPDKNEPESDPRGTIYNLLFQEGKYLDYYTGLHDPSISENLRGLLMEKGELTEDEIKLAVPKDKHHLFPQLRVDYQWPATIMIHGTVDDVVPIEESRHLYEIIKKTSKSPVKLIEVQGDHAFHGWDCFPEAESITKCEFDTVRDFIQHNL